MEKTHFQRIFQHNSLGKVKNFSIIGNAGDVPKLVRDGSAKALFLGSSPSVTFTTAFLGGCFFYIKNDFCIS